MPEPDDWAHRFLKRDKKRWLESLLLTIHDLLTQELKQVKKGINEQDDQNYDPQKIRPKIKRLLVIESIFELQKEIDERKQLLNLSTPDQIDDRLIKLSISLNHQN